MTGTGDGWDQSPPHVGPSWVAVNHYNRTSTGAFVYVVDSEPVQVNPSFREWPSVKVRPALSDHLQSLSKTACSLTRRAAPCRCRDLVARGRRLRYRVHDSA